MIKKFYLCINMTNRAERYAKEEGYEMRMMSFCCMHQTNIFLYVWKMWFVG